MSQQNDNLHDNENGFAVAFEDTVQELKNKAVSKLELEKYDWIKPLRLKCKSYIENNGTKNLTIDELRDLVLQEAIDTFPQSIKDQLDEELETFMYQLEMVSVFSKDNKTEKSTE